MAKMGAKTWMKELSSYFHTVSLKDCLRAHDGKPCRCATM